LFVGVGEGHAVLIVERDGRQSLHPIVELITNELARVRTATRRNRMWTVAPDGGVWFWQGAGNLTRRDDAGEQIYETAVTSDYIEVDENNHVWLADGALWRMSPEPDFDLRIQPGLWLMTADDVQTGRIEVAGIEGFNEAVTLSISGLPAGVSATITPNPVAPGETASVQITTAAAPLGDYDVLLKGAAGAVVHERPFRLAVVAQVYEMILPVVAR
jgi:hypothetical protein